MTINYKQEPTYLYTLERWCLKRWLHAMCKANAIAGLNAPRQYALWAKRADQWFAAVERVARLTRLAQNA